MLKLKTSLERQCFNFATKDVKKTFHADIGIFDCLGNHKNNINPGILKIGLLFT